MVRGEVWWAATRPGGDRPVLVLTRDPAADRANAVVVAPCTRRIRGLGSELRLGPDEGLPEDCVASFDNLTTVSRADFRTRIARLSPDVMEMACRVLARALGCG